MLNLRISWITLRTCALAVCRGLSNWRLDPVCEESVRISVFDFELMEGRKSLRQVLRHSRRRGSRKPRQATRPGRSASSETSATAVGFRRWSPPRGKEIQCPQTSKYSFQCVVVLYVLYSKKRFDLYPNTMTDSFTAQGLSRLQIWFVSNERRTS